MQLKKRYIFAAQLVLTHKKITTMAKNNEKSTNVAIESEVNNNVVNNAEKVDAPKDQSTKVSAKVAIKSIGKVAKLIRSERIGVNATIRLLLESAHDGDEDAINTMCALCDVPTDMAFSLTVDDVRKAVNDYYPYVRVTESGRKINVRAKSVYYSTASTEEEMIEDARKRVTKGYYAVDVIDYLTALTVAAKARAKGIKQRSVNDSRVYDDEKFANANDVPTIDILAAQKSHTFEWYRANVWKKHKMFGYYL